MTLNHDAYAKQNQTGAATAPATLTQSFADRLHDLFKSAQHLTEVCMVNADRLLGEQGRGETNAKHGLAPVANGTLGGIDDAIRSLDNAIAALQTQVERFNSI